MKETGYSQHIYQNELDKACFQHEIALPKRKVLINYYVIKHLIFLKTENMFDVNVNLLQWLTNFVIKKNLGGGIKTKNISRQELAEELHKAIIKKRLKNEKYTYRL